MTIPRLPELVDISRVDGDSRPLEHRAAGPGPTADEAADRDLVEAGTIRREGHLGRTADQERAGEKLEAGRYVEVLKRPVTGEEHEVDRLLEQLLASLPH